MEISSIKSSLTPFLSPISSDLTRGSDISGLTGDSGSFSSMIRGAIERLDGQQKGAETEIAKAVTGESPDLHRTIASLQTAELSFQYALQVRNKFIGAYEEIMRMQI